MPGLLLRNSLVMFLSAFTLPALIVFDVARSWPAGIGLTALLIGALERWRRDDRGEQQGEGFVVTRMILSVSLLGARPEVWGALLLAQLAIGGLWCCATTALAPAPDGQERPPGISTGRLRLPEGP